MTLILVLCLTQVCALLARVFVGIFQNTCEFYFNYIFSELYQIIFSFSLVSSFLGHKYY